MIGEAMVAAKFVSLVAVVTVVVDSIKFVFAN
jgi:hypothetical protein